MDIYQAKTIDEKNRCFKWLQSAGYLPLTDLLFWYGDKDTILACAGLLLMVGDQSRVGVIEPFLSDSSTASLHLYRFCEGYLKALNVGSILVTTRISKVENILTTRFEYEQWGSGLKQLIKKNRSIKWAHQM